MTFHSVEFVAFFVLTLAAYWSLPTTPQNVLLLAASYVFYGWVHPWWLVLLFATTTIDYWAARNIEDRPAGRKAWLWLSITANLGLLGVYKYFDFFIENASAAAAALGWHVPTIALRLALPAGISFYTFQSMSYTIDVYLGHAPARRRFVDVAAFVSFFPHLVAGPIMRATNLLPQFEQPRTLSMSAARDASVLMLWGFFKKVVIADNVGMIANKVFAVADPGFFVLWAGVFAFAIQIYADFSAYTDIAKGVARWFGFELITNFRQPYLATSPADFWHRWNISLSTWFRDYVYIPLGGSRRGRVRHAINLVVTFLVSGFWHGASWNYVVWGGYHGVLMVMSGRSGRVSAPPRRWLIPMRIVATFVLVCIGWLFFRETELSQLWRDLRLSPFSASPQDRAQGMYLFLLTSIYAAPLWLHDVWAETTATTTEQESSSVSWGRVGLQAAACGLMAIGLLMLQSEGALNFIYFAF